MGSCTSTLQKEHIPINNLKNPRHTVHRPFANASSTVTHSVIPEPSEPSAVSFPDTKQRQHQHQQQTDIQNEELIGASFHRTLFCEDIVYEYKMHCNILDHFDQYIVPQWSVRLTVESMTEFYLQTLEHYDDLTDDGQTIPFQFGKVMKPKVFTSLIYNILHKPKMLKDDNTVYSNATADFLCIPYEIRCILQYNPQQFVSDAHTLEAFRYYQVICKYNDKYKYLCHTTRVYQPEDQRDIISYSYWVRSLHHKVDFLFTITSRNVFMLFVNDLSFNIVQILKKHFAVDDLLAWIIADYLPKYLVFNHDDERCNAQILYQYDPRVCEEDYGIFYLNIIGNKLLQRHDINPDELHLFCDQMRDEHTAIPIAEATPSVSEDMLSMTKAFESMVSQYDENADGSGFKEDASYVSMMTTTDEHKREIEEKSFQSTVSQYMALHNDVDRSDIDEDKFRIFFTTFIDYEGEDDVNMCQWMESLNKLNINLTEKQIVDAFNFMCEEESEGYVDFVDFTNFCQLQVDADVDIRRTQQVLNSFIL